MCFSKPKLPEPEKVPTADEAAEAARAGSLERRRKISTQGRGSTILAGRDIAQEQLKKTLGA